MKPQVDTDAFQRVVVAGLKIMYSPQTREMLMQGLQSGGDPAEILAREVAGLLRLMDGKSQGKMPKQVMVPAGAALMQDLIKFVKEAGIFEVDQETAMKAMQMMVQMLVREYSQPQDQQAPAPQQPGGLIQQGAMQ